MSFHPEHGWMGGRGEETLRLVHSDVKLAEHARDAKQDTKLGAHA
jgi:hypothetical protein